MAETATAENVQTLDLSRLVDDIEARISGQKPMTEAKTDYDGLCKAQNERAGYHKKAMNMLTALGKMSPEKFQDCIRTLQPGLDQLIEHRAATETPDMLGDNVTALNV